MPLHTPRLVLAAALGWLAAEWTVHGRPSVLGIVSGAVAGLVAVTPAAWAPSPRRPTAARASW